MVKDWENLTMNEEMKLLRKNNQMDEPHLFQAEKDLFPEGSENTGLGSSSRNCQETKE